MACVKLDLSKRTKQTVPMSAPRFDSLDDELQRIFATVAAEKNMSPQDYVDYLHDPNRTPLTIKEFVAGLNTSHMGTFTQEELFEVLDEVRGGY
jgi:hypothetical protein